MVRRTTFSHGVVPRGWSSTYLNGGRGCMGRISAASILRQLARIEVIPEDAAISGRGVATWE
jgi:hypothetical protein